jgi:Tfp pilus assembly protein PilF/O-antigen ligase
MTALPILILAALAVFGAGLVPGVAPPMAAALLAAACLRPLPPSRAFRVSIWLLVALAAGLVVSLLPAPAWAGSWRLAAWGDIQAFTARHGSLCGGYSSRPVSPHLSLHLGGTLRWLVLVLGAGGMFSLTASLHTRQRVIVVKALVVLGAIVAAAGLVGRLLVPAGATLVWWYPVAEIGGGTPFGPFVNRNHFAAFCALLAPLAVALTCHLPAPSAYATAHAADAEVSLDVSPGGRLLYGACLIALMAAILCSQSRGGTAAVLLGLVVVALLWMRRGPAAAALATLAGVGGLLLVALWPNAGFQGRLFELRDAATAIGARWPVWLDSLRVWHLVPLAGCGANGFGMVFPQVTTWATGQQASHAESDYLQLLAEGGVVGVLLVGALLVASCLPLLRALRPGQRRSHHQLALPYPILAGIAGALAAIGLHSALDVPLRVPLCAWTAAALAGLAVPLAPRRRRSGDRPTALWPERVALAALLALILAVSWIAPGWRALYRDRDAWLAEAASAEIVALLRETPSYWQAWYEVGDRLCNQAAGAAEPQAAALLAAGWDALRAAIRCSPRDPRLRAAFAARLWAAGRWDEARSQRDAQFALLPQDRALRRRWLQAEWEAGQTADCRQLAYRFAAEAPTDPATPDYLAWLAQRELAEGSVTQARLALQTVLARRPHDVDALKGLAQCAKRLGEPDEEARWLGLLAAGGHADAPVWWRLGELALSRRDRQALQEALGKAVQLDSRRRHAADDVWKAFNQDRGGAPP